jgi:hypothetical protein
MTDFQDADSGGESSTARFADIYGDTAGQSSTTERRPGGGLDLRRETEPSSSSTTRRTTEDFRPPQTGRLNPQTEEGSIPGQEQPPETRRTVVRQGSTGTQHFSLSPDKADTPDLINIGYEYDPVFVKTNENR